MLPNKARQQLVDFSKKKDLTDERITTSHGIPIGDKTTSLTVGKNGPMLLQDTVYLDEMQHFDRETVPERVVHAKGAGAFGYFEVTHDITKYCKAVVFEKVGKRTPLAVRFSTASGNLGSPDTTRNHRGFAVKFYTEDGNWDLVGNNLAMFFIRDPILFPSLMHVMKRNPVTNLKDANAFWDFLTLRPETCFHTTFLFSDRGIPDGYRYFLNRFYQTKKKTVLQSAIYGVRHMDGFGQNTFKLVNDENHVFYCKFHYKTDQGIKNLTTEEANRLAGINPDYATEDLFNSIANGSFPSWTLYIQVMTPEEALKTSFNPFDVTKIWPKNEFPLIPVGKIVLNRNPSNFFAEVEQIAFSPANMIPGIEASPDRVLQGRLFSYADTHQHRLGANYTQIPINCPIKARNYQINGPLVVNDNQNGQPNYYPNSFSGPKDNKVYSESEFVLNGAVQRHDTGDEDNFSQVGRFWRETLSEEEKSRLIKNMSSHLIYAAEFIQDRAIDNFRKCDEEYGARLEQAIKHLRSQKTLPEKSLF